MDPLDFDIGKDLAKEERQRLSEFAIEKQSADVDPARQAKALRVSKEKGLPVDLVERNLDDIDKPKFDFSSMREDSPQLYRLLTEKPEHAAIVKHNVQNMQSWERVWGNLKQSYNQSFDGIEMGDINNRRMDNGGVWASPEDQERYNELKASQKKATPYYDSTYDIGNIPGIIANAGVSMATPIVRSWDEALIGAGAGAAFGVPGAVVGLKVGVAVGTTKEIFNMQRGEIYGEARETLDEEGVPLDHDVSWTVAAAGGAIGTALERIGLKSVSKAVPGLDKLMSFGGKELIQLAAKNPVARKHIGAVGKILRAGATEGITELLQSVVALEGIMLAGGVTDEGGSRLADSRLERYPEAAYSGVVGGGGIAAAGQASKPVADKAGQKIKDVAEPVVQSWVQVKAKAKAQSLRELGGNISSSELAKMSPETIEAFANVLDEDSQVSLSVSPDAVRKLFQEEGMTGEQLELMFPNVAAQLEDVQATGAEIDLTAYDFMKISKMGGFDEFISDVRAAPDEITEREALDLEAQVESIKEEMDADPEAVLPGSDLQPGIEEQLLQAGRDPEVAKRESSILAAALKQQGEEAGLTEQEMAERYGLSVVNETLDDVVRDDEIRLTQDQDGSINTESDAFKQWFGDSKVVDEQKRPLGFFHHGSFDENTDVPSGAMHFGTREAAEARSVGKVVDDAAMDVDAYQNDDGVWHWDDGLGFSSEENGEAGFGSKQTAIDHGQAWVVRQMEDGVDISTDDGMTEAYLSIKNPKRIKDQGGAEGEWDAAIEQAKAEGHDGIVYRNEYEDKGSDSYITFGPTQIKSVNNRGTFGPNDPRTLYQSTVDNSIAGGLSGKNKISIDDIGGATIIPMFADLADSGRAFDSLDGVPIEPTKMFGGPNFVNLKEYRDAGIVWAFNSKGIITGLRNKVRHLDEQGAERVIVTMLAMKDDAHLSNTMTTLALLRTLKGFVDDGRLPKNSLKKARDFIKGKSGKKDEGYSALASLPTFNNMERLIDWVSDATFNTRKALSKEMQSAGFREILGDAVSDRVARELIDPEYRATQQGDALLAFEIDPDADNLVVNFDSDEAKSEGIPRHPSYRYGLRGKLVGSFGTHIPMNLLYQDLLKTITSRAKKGANPKFLMERLRKEDAQVVTPKIIKEAKMVERLHDYKVAQAYSAALAGEWRSSFTPANRGGVNPAEFELALRENQATATLTHYTREDITKGKADGSFEVFQLGDKSVKAGGLSTWFGIKRGYDYSAEYDHPTVAKLMKDGVISKEEVALVGVANNETGVNGLGTFQVLKAIEEGATVLDAFKVKSKEKPHGLLPTIYATIGFEEVGVIPFDPKFYSANQIADLEAVWSSQGWQKGDAYPDVAIMKYRGSEDARENATTEFISKGYDSFGRGRDAELGEYQAEARHLQDGAGAGEGSAGVSGSDNGRPDIGGIQERARRISRRGRNFVDSVLSADATALASLRIPTDRVEKIRQAFEETTLYQDGPDNGPFYSGVLRAVEGLNQPKAPPAQWIATIKKQAGVKAEELEWLGVEEWLKGQGKSVTKEDLLDYIRANQIVLEETTLGGANPADMGVVNVKLSNDRLWLVTFEDGNEVSIPKTKAATEVEAVDMARGRLALETRDERTKHESYTLDGGENYQELLMRLPKKDSTQQTGELPEDWVVWRGTQFEDGTGNIPDHIDPNLFYVLDDRTDIVAEGQSRELAIENAQPAIITPVSARVSDRDNFRSSHFDQANILAHVRFNERVDADGKRVLFIEEIQSDWHQAGRKRGYASERKFDIYQEGDIWRVRDENGQRVDPNGFSGFSTEADAQKAIDTMPAREKTGSAVPDAPFKTSWAELAFKRMLREAVDKGYDKIAWTPGDIQNERYDLSKQVNGIYLKEQDGLRHFSIDGYDEIRGTEEVLGGAFDETGKVVSSKTGDIQGKDLDEVVGKEIAEKMLSVPMKDGKARIDNADLRVGGDGMKGFYDKILPNAVNKLVKKYGGKVGTTKIDTPATATKEDIALLDELGVEGTRKPNAEVWSLDINDKMKGAIEAGLPLFQKGAKKSKQDGPRGFIQFGELRDHFKITLTGRANLSTFVHESWHMIAEIMLDLEARGEASQRQIDDLNRLRKYVGAEEGQVGFTRAQHEKIARSGEAYLMEGRAPSTELRDTFRRFKAWMTFVYKKMANLNVDLDDEVRGVFDRILASDKAIAEARTEIGQAPAPLDQDTLALTDAEYEEYKEAWTKAREKEKEVLDARTMLDAASELKRAWDLEVKKVSERLMKDLEATESHKVWKAILDGDEKISVDSIPAEYKKFAFGLTTDEGGIPLDLMAENMGYDIGIEMLRDINQARSTERDIRRQAVAMVKQAHGHLNPKTLSDAALRAVHDDDSIDVLFSEFRAMAEKADIKVHKGLSARLRGIAEEKVGDLTGRQLQPGKYRRAEINAAKESAAAAARGDVMAAALAKRQQMVSAAMYRATVDQKQKMETRRKKLRPFQGNKRRSVLGKAGDIYLDGIDELLESVNLKKVSARSVQKANRLAALVAHAEAAGQPLILPERLMESLGKVAFDDMTMDDQQALHDSVMNIWHLAKLKNKLKDGKFKRDLHEVLDQMAVKAEETMGADKAQPGNVKTIGEKAKHLINRGRAALVKTEFLFQWLDGQVSGGLMHRLIFQPLVDAGKREYEIMRRFNETLLEPLRNMPKEQKTRWNTKLKFMGENSNGATIIMAALNTGNKGNRKKLIEGRGWDEAAFQAELDAFMTKDDWDMVQLIWREINTLLPEIQRVSKLATGLPAAEVKPDPVVTPFGTYEGGYFPVVYDPERNEQQFRNQESAEGLFTNNFVKPKLGDGFTEARTGYVGPILLDMRVLSSHLSEVVHYVTHYEAIEQANKITSHPKFDAIVSGKFGKQFYRQIKPWLQDIARDQDTPAITKQEPFSAAMKHLRGGVSVASMGYNVFTAFKQLLGVTTALDAISSRYWVQGMAKTFVPGSGMAKNWKFAMESSAELEKLVKDFNRDIKMVNDSFAKKTEGTAWEAFGRHAFTMIGLFQLTVNVAAWQGAYDEALIRDGLTHQEAVNRADSIVRTTQSSGAVKDLAAIQRGSETSRAVSMFYSWFSAVYNRIEDIAKKTNSIKDVPMVARRVGVLLFLTALMEETGREAYDAVKEALGYEDEDDDDDLGFILTVLMKGVDTGIAAVPLVRSFVSVESAFTPKITPLEGFAGNVDRMYGTIAKGVIEGEGPTRSEAKNVARTVSTITKKPFYGFYRVIDEALGETIFDE